MSVRHPLFAPLFARMAPAMDSLVAVAARQHDRVRAAGTGCWHSG